MKNRKKFKIGAWILALTVTFSTMIFSVPTYAMRADEIPTGTPVVDGVMEELWNGASNKIAIEMLTSGDSNATAYARMMWDSSYLYVLGYVNDKTLSTYEPSGSDWWVSDSFEVFLDERNAHNTVKNEIAQIRVSRKGTLSGMLNSAAVDQAGVLAEYAGTKWAAKNVDSNGTYVVEMAIPWTRISSPSVGTQIGTEFQINDMHSNAGGGTQDGVVNSEVVDVWKCQTYRMMTLSSTVASAGETPSSGTTDPGTTNPGTTNPGTTDPGTTNPGTTAPGTADPETTDPSTTDTSSEGTDSTDATTDENDDEKADKSDEKVNTDQTNEEESELNLGLVIGIVGGVVLLVIAGCVTFLIIYKKKNK